MISTFEIVMLSFLAILIGFAAWWLAIAMNYNSEVTEFTYARGANFDPGPGKTSGEVTLHCDDAREICVSSAVVVCSGTNDTRNYDIAPNQYITTGDNYGNFNPLTSANITEDLIKLTAEKQTYIYAFDGTKLLPSCNTGVGGSVRPQLIATYTCAPTGTNCGNKVPEEEKV